jgi:hypothetical protein
MSSADPHTPVRRGPIRIEFSYSDSAGSDSGSVELLKEWSDDTSSPGDLIPDPGPPERAESAGPSSLRLLDRYRNTNSTSRFSSRDLMTTITERRVHYAVHRRHTRKNGLKRRLFQLTDAQTLEVIAAAQFTSATSSVIDVCNSRGTICEVDVKSSKGPFILRQGMDPLLIVSIGDKGSRCLEFKESEGDSPLYPPMQSPAKSCADIPATFGNRRAIASVKNCRFCSGGEEVVAVRKIQKNAIEIDAKYNVPFFYCFGIGIAMFLAKG